MTTNVYGGAKNTVSYQRRKAKDDLRNSTIKNTYIPKLNPIADQATALYLDNFESIYNYKEGGRVLTLSDA